MLSHLQLVLPEVLQNDSQANGCHVAVATLITNA